MTIQPHVLTLSNTLFWLAEQEEIAGSVSNENDIKIATQQRGTGMDILWYRSIRPTGIFGIGFAQIRRRKNKGGQ